MKKIVAHVVFLGKSLPKIEAKLENKKINYIVVDRRNNFDVDEISNNKNLNTYDKEFEKARKYINIKNRIDNIYIKLIKDINKEETKRKIIEIEKIV